jgi:hypothetical protein
MEETLKIILIILVSLLVISKICNYHKYSNTKMKWTCGIEGGCFKTPFGTYESREECQKKCGNR